MNIEPGLVHGTLMLLPLWRLGCERDIEGFQCFKHDRDGDKIIALLIRENIMAVIRENIQGRACTEAIWVILKNKKGSITLMGLYCKTINSQLEKEEQIYIYIYHSE